MPFPLCRPSLNEIDRVLHQELRPEFAELERERRWAVIAVFVTGAAFVFAALFLRRAHASADAWQGTFGGLLAAGALVNSWLRKGYLKKFREQVMPKLVMRFFPGLSFQPEGCVARELYAESQLFRQQLDGYEGGNLFRGKIGEASFQFSELHCWYETGSGKNRSRQDAFHGLFFVGDFHREFFFRTTIHPDLAESMLGVLGRGLQRVAEGGRLVDLEDPEFERLFVVTSDDQVEARYILTPVVMEKLREFRSRVGRNVHLCFANGKMFLAINTGGEFFKPHLFGEILTRGDLMRFIDMLLLIQGVAADFMSQSRWGVKPQTKSGI